LAARTSRPLRPSFFLKTDFALPLLPSPTAKFKKAYSVGIANDFTKGIRKWWT
jgi:hypothetical protein